MDFPSRAHNVGYRCVINKDERILFTPAASIYFAHSKPETPVNHLTLATNKTLYHTRKQSLVTDSSTKSSYQL